MTVVKMNRNEPNKKPEVLRDEELEATNEAYEKELRRHRIRRTWIVIALVGLVLIAVVVISLVQRKSSFSSYKVEASTRRNDAGAAEYLYFAGNLYRCSRDGVAAYDNSGNSLWNSTYEVSNMMISVGGSYFAVADRNGNDAYLFHTTQGSLGSVNSSQPILAISVADAGYIALLVEDNGADYIHLYDMNGSHQKIYTIKKSINIDGLPLCMAVSPDGQKLVSAYTGVASGKLGTNLVFSNFDEVGQNKNERVVGGYDYKDELIGKISFLDATTAVVVGEKSLDFYRIKEYPSQLSQVELDYQITYVFTSTGYVGLLHKDVDTGYDILEVYNSLGVKLLTKTMENSDLTTYRFAGDSVMVYGSNQCRIFNMKGNTFFEYTFEDGIVDLFPIDGNREFIYINSDYVQKIRLE